MRTEKEKVRGRESGVKLYGVAVTEGAVSVLLRIVWGNLSDLSARV